MIYGAEVPLSLGNRFYLSYSGSAPTGANCTTLCNDVATAFGSNLASLIPGYFALKEVDVLDIASATGFSSQTPVSESGTRSGTSLPLQCATNVEFGIDYRYRGGKPRMYLPPGVEADLLDQSHYQGSFVTAVDTGVAAFFTALEGLSIGSMGTLAHVVLSYFDGYDKNQPPTGKWRGPGFKYPPAYRSEALHYAVSGYAAKATISSQKRRRTSTTP